MHQKNNQTAEPSSATLHDVDDGDDDLRDPFADGEDDLDDDDDILGDGGRGSWWRGVVRRKISEEERGSDDGNDHDDDEEFGDFAMAEDENEKGDEENVVLKPLAVNPAKEGNRGLSGLWPFGSKSDKEKQTEGTADASPVDISSEKKTEPEPEQPSAVEVKEAKRRTSIEDPDEEEPIKV